MKRYPLLAVSLLALTGLLRPFAETQNINGNGIAVVPKAPYKVDVIVIPLKHSWSIAFMPDDRMLVVRKTGIRHIVTQSGLVGNILKELPKTSLVEVTRVCSTL